METKQLNADPGASNLKICQSYTVSISFIKQKLQVRERLRKIEILEELCVEYGGIPTSNVRSPFYGHPFSIKPMPNVSYYHFSTSSKLDQLRNSSILIGFYDFSAGTKGTTA